MYGFHLSARHRGGCVEVSDDPSPTMIEMIRGVSRLIEKTLDELERGNAYGRL
jgi:hypothetical protein